MTLTSSDLRPDAQSHLTRQSYEPMPAIEGVIIEETMVFADDGGSLTELARSTNGKHARFADFEIRQVNYSQILPGVIKAFHLHLTQNDVWYVPPTDRLLVVLTDQRAVSATANQTMRFILGGGKSRLVYIPHGVGHGVANLGTTASSLIYFVNQQFDKDEPDEQRLPWDFLGKDIWEMTRG